MKIRQFYKNHLTNVRDIPATELKAFNEKILSINLFRERVSACIICVYVFCNLFLDLLLYGGRWSSMPGYKFLFFIHVGSLALYSGMLIFHHINDKKNLKLDKAIHYLYIIVGFLMNEALSINAQLINGQIVTYVIALMGISVLLLLHSYEMIVAISLSFLTFMIGILLVQHNTLMITSVINNTLAAIICSLLFSRLSFSAYVNEFLINRELEGSLRTSTELNASLSHTLRELELQRAKLHNIVESTDDFIWSVDRDFKVITYNSAIKNYLDKTIGAEWEQGNFTDFLAADSATGWTDLYDVVVKAGKYQVDLCTKSGDRTFTYSLNGVYIDSELTEITIFGKDITDRISKERDIIRQNLLLERRVDERTKELRNIIDDTSAMIERLFQYAASSDREIYKETIDIKKMVVTVYSELKKNDDGKSSLCFETGLPKIKADKALFLQVITNIISNALKSAAKRPLPEITVGCWEKDGEYVFHIKDNGVGCDTETAGKLFEVSEHSPYIEKRDETYIGLAVAKRIIDRHGGRTWIEREPDRGTTVYFSLPV